MTDPVEVNDRLIAAAVKAEGASEIMRRLANDPVHVMIPTESGLIPSLAEWLRLNEEAIGDLTTIRSDVQALKTLASKASRQATSVANLRATAGRFDGDVINLIAYNEGWNAYAKPRTQASGPLIWNSLSTEADDTGVTFAVTGVTTGRWQRPVLNRVYSAWYDVISGDLSESQAPKVQKATTTGCTKYGGVIHPFGRIRIDETISHPNYAFDIDGISGTGTEFVTDTAGLVMFDFSLCNGPAKNMRGIGFSKITPGTYNNITAVKTFNTNGLLLTNCWARGLLYGLEFHGSFINMTNCTFEYCYKGVRGLTPFTESAWVGTTFYKCEQADVEMTGDNSSFSSSNSNHIGTRIDGWLLNNCTNARIDQISFANDGGTFTPNLIRLAGVCSGNTFDQIGSSNFGKAGIVLEGANVKRNKFTNVSLRGTPATGNRGVKCTSSSGNIISGSIEGFEAGIEFISSSDTFVGQINGCSVGTLLNGANYCTLDVVNEGNTADVQTSNTTIVYLQRFIGDNAGLAGIPYLVSRSGYGDVIEVSQMPNSLSWKKGARAVNTRNPVAGQPKSWMRMTTGSTNVAVTDWLSEGNL